MLLKRPAFFLILLTFISLLSSSAPKKISANPIVPEPNIYWLDNGLKIMVIENNSVPLAAVDVWVRAGTVNETPENNGISHLIEHVIFKGTDRRGPGEMDLEIESIGATLDASTSKDWAHFWTTVPSRHIEKAFDVLSDAIMNAKMDEEDFERERAVVWDEIAKNESDPTASAFALLDSTAFTKHPYRLPIEGTRESIARLTRDELFAYYRRYYVPANTTLIVVGDVKSDSILALAKKYFGSWTGAKFPLAQVTPEPERIGVRRAYKKRDTKLSYLIVAFGAPSIFAEKDVYAADLLLTYLGVGYGSWMATEIKDKLKLADEVTAEYLTRRDPGLFSFYAAVKLGKEKEVEEIIVSKVKEISVKPLSAEELLRAKRSLLGSYAFECETFSGKARALGFYDAIGNHKMASEYEAKINEITAEDIQTFAAKYLIPDNRIVVLISPEEPYK